VRAEDVSLVEGRRAPKDSARMGTSSPTLTFRIDMAFQVFAGRAGPNRGMCRSVPFLVTARLSAGSPTNMMKT